MTYKLFRYLLVGEDHMGKNKGFESLQYTAALGLYRAQ